jgi:hypothetical protein
MRAFIRSFDLPNNTLDYTTIFESPELCFIAPELTEPFCMAWIGVIRRRAMVHETRCVLWIVYKSYMDDGGI